VLESDHPQRRGIDNDAEYTQRQGRGYLDGPASPGHLPQLGGKGGEGGKGGLGEQQGVGDGLEDHGPDGERQQTMLGEQAQLTPGGWGRRWGGLHVDDVPLGDRGSGGGADGGDGRNGGLLGHREVVLPQQLRRGEAGKAQHLEGIPLLLLLAQGVAIIGGGRGGGALKEPVQCGGDSLVVFGVLGCLFAFRLLSKLDGRHLSGVHALVAPVDVLEVLVELELLGVGVVVPGGDATAGTSSGEEAAEETAGSFRFGCLWRNLCWIRILAGTRRPSAGRRDGEKVSTALGGALVVVAVAVAQADGSPVGLGHNRWSSSGRSSGGTTGGCARISALLHENGRRPLPEGLDSGASRGGQHAGGRDGRAPSDLSSHIGTGWGGVDRLEVVFVTSIALLLLLVAALSSFGACQKLLTVKK
jgi:hypothetical protein